MNDVTVVAGLVVGVVEVALFFLIGLWLTAAMFRVSQGTRAVFCVVIKMKKK